MGLFKDEHVSWDKINGLRDRSAKSHFKDILLLNTVGGNIGNPSK